MKYISRRISFIIVFCYIIAASFPIQSYGASNSSITDNRTLQEQKSSSTGMSNSEENDDKNTTVSTDRDDDGTDGKAAAKITDVTETANGTTDDTADETANETTEDTADETANETATEPSNKTNNSTEAKTKSSTTTSDTKETKDEDAEKNEEELWYRKQNPMDKEHQKLLWEYCIKRDLSYIDMLALIYTESNFNEKCTTGKHHGYFQISTGNCANLAKTLNTKNKPLDGAININWGTSIYSGILADKRVKDLEGKKRRDVALSIYQRGTGGYDKYGINKNFLKVYYKKWDKINEWFKAK